MMRENELNIREEDIDDWFRKLFARTIDTFRDQFKKFVPNCVKEMYFIYIDIDYEDNGVGDYEVVDGYNLGETRKLLYWELTVADFINMAVHHRTYREKPEYAMEVMDYIVTCFASCYKQVEGLEELNLLLNLPQGIFYDYLIAKNVVHDTPMTDKNDKLENLMRRYYDRIMFKYDPSYGFEKYFTQLRIGYDDLYDNLVLPLADLTKIMKMSRNLEKVFAPYIIYY